MAQRLQHPRPYLVRQGETENVELPSDVLASQSLLVPLYPGAIDTKPTLTDNVTLLTAIYINFLQMLVEAVEAQVGPLDEDADTKVFGADTLRDFLDDISFGDDSTTLGGRIVGLMRVRVAQTVAVSAPKWDVDVTFEAWRRIPGSVPIFFGLMNQEHLTGEHSTSDMVNGALSFRGDVFWTSADPTVTTMRLQGRAIKMEVHGGDPSPPASGAKFVLTGFVVFLKQSTSF